MHLQDASILVTGGGSGLGAGCARRFVDEGAHVTLVDVNDTAGRNVASSLGQRATFQHVDVTKPEEVQKAIDAASAAGPFRGVVHCAGILGAARVLGKEGPHDLELFTRVIHVNLIGTFNVVRLAAARMAETQPLENGERGVIINTSSVAAFDGQIGQAAYSAAKGGVASITLPLARELARFGIRVMAVAPGIFNTSMMAAAPEAVTQSLLDQTVFPKRFGEPAEFASLAVQIFENPMLNGTVIRLDGSVRMAAK